jgi:hypothetical protein
MALSEFESKQVERAVSRFMERRRPPPHIRPELDLGYRLSGQSVEIFEIRPVWKNPKEKMEHPVAKATYVKTRAVWKVYWIRADLKWHSYGPVPTVGDIKKFLELVENDKHACFFG